MVYTIEELLPVVVRLSEKCTGNESTSITYEKARQLMGAVQYVIRLYEEGKGNRIQTVEKCSAMEAYDRGCHILQDRVCELQKRYVQLRTHFEAYENENYSDTVEKGIAAFFQYYDPEFAPMNTVITMDYPVLGGSGNKQGILAMETYIRKIELEQEFFQCIPHEKGCALLAQYHPHYRKLFDNICYMMLRGVLEQMTQVSVSHDNKNMTREEWTQIVTNCIEILVEQQYGNNKKLADYLALAIPDYVTEKMINDFQILQSK